MPQDAPPNGSAQGPAPEGPWSRVAGMQAKLHRWAAADPGRRFGDLFNFVHDPATLYVAYCRVEGNRGANTPGVDGMTVRLVEQRIGVREFPDDLRAQLKTGAFRPLPVRQRLIPKPGGPGKLRKLGRSSAGGTPPPQGGGCRSPAGRPSCGGSTRYRSPGTATAAARSPAPGPCQNTPDGRNRGEPVASRGARRVRRAAWRNGLAATLEPRSRPTQRGTGPGRHCGAPGRAGRHRVRPRPQAARQDR
jgi:hypothetical protein